MQSKFDLKYIIDMDEWGKLQESLSLVTRMAIIMVDYKGVPVTAHSRCQAFCQTVRSDKEFSAYCQKCDARGGLEAVRLSRPYIYRCHFDILDIAIPIIVDNQYIGALMAGQIRLAEGSGPNLEQIVSRPQQDAMTEDRARKYELLPVMTYEEVVATADMLYHLCNYVVKESILKHELLERSRQHEALNPQESKLQLELPHQPVEPPSAPKTPVSLGSAYKTECTNPTLQPALDYMLSHREENFSLKMLAQLCHISPSYFSRLFTREMGEHFSLYVARMKIGWAKELLATTDWSVNEISNHLNFCDAGYFIKIFKKYESATPRSYRASLKTDPI
ncbi:PocR ligand-binding domain-containing protein [Paenibacillus sp. FSL R7-0333]|uniref:PocR ligand-binding domain-containing protein n=1 Tax=Paenibacillus sp. FSL R7-0333 TaxID=1926587 RepID=UPI00096C76AE|nr:transcriptional regulator [Paenibacillus sp. FSL R7-0333]